MKKYHINFLIFFILPTVVIGVVYSILVLFWPNHVATWNGILICTCISAVFYIWSELSSNKETLNSIYASSLTEAQVFSTYKSWMNEAKNCINLDNNSFTIVKVYKGYSHSLNIEKDYFSATLKAIECTKIERYYRIMAVRNANDAKCCIQILKLFNKECKSLEKVRFYISFDPSPNFNSFVTIGDKMNLIALPDLSDGTESMPGHRSGMRVVSETVNRSLNEIFASIRSSVYTYSIDLQAITNWETYQDRIIEACNRAKLLTSEFDANKAMEDNDLDRF